MQTVLRLTFQYISYIRIAFISLLGFFVLTQAAFAQVNPPTAVTTLQGFFIRLTELINIIVPFLLAAGALFVIVQVIRYVIAGNENEKKKGGMYMLWGIIGIAVVLAFWSLTAIVVGTFGIPVGGTLNLNTIPCVDIPGANLCP